MVEQLREPFEKFVDWQQWAAVMHREAVVDIDIYGKLLNPTTYSVPCTEERIVTFGITIILGLIHKGLSSNQHVPRRYTNSIRTYR
jgi:hypothetical protein